MGSAVGVCRWPLAGLPGVPPHFLGRGGSAGDPVDAKIRREAGGKSSNRSRGRGFEGKNRDKFSNLWKTGWPNPEEHP